MSDEQAIEKRVIIRPRAIADIDRHVDYLEENATAAVAFRFRSAVENAIAQIAFMPGTGAPRKVRNTLLSGLRMRIIPEFRNHLIFYITPDGAIEIVRVLDGAQDVSSILESEEA